MTARGAADVLDENFSPGVALVVSLLGLVGIPRATFERIRLGAHDMRDRPLQSQCEGCSVC
jgi:hypothetical protein